MMRTESFQFLLFSSAAVQILRRSQQLRLKTVRIAAVITEKLSSSFSLHRCRLSYLTYAFI